MSDLNLFNDENYRILPNRPRKSIPHFGLQNQLIHEWMLEILKKGSLEDFINFFAPALPFVEPTAFLSVIKIWDDFHQLEVPEELICCDTDLIPSKSSFSDYVEYLYEWTYQAEESEVRYCYNRNTGKVEPMEDEFDSIANSPLPDDFWTND
jgi:hypothetical protein